MLALLVLLGSAQAGKFFNADRDNIRKIMVFGPLDNVAEGGPLNDAMNVFNVVGDDAPQRTLQQEFDEFFRGRVADDFGPDIDAGNFIINGIVKNACSRTLGAFGKSQFADTVDPNDDNTGIPAPAVDLLRDDNNGVQQTVVQAGFRFGCDFNVGLPPLFDQRGEIFRVQILDPTQAEDFNNEPGLRQQLGLFAQAGDIVLRCCNDETQQSSATREVETAPTQEFCPGITVRFCSPSEQCFPEHDNLGGAANGDCSGKVNLVADAGLPVTQCIEDADSLRGGICDTSEAGLTIGVIVTVFITTWVALSATAVRTACLSCRERSSFEKRKKKKAAQKSTVARRDNLEDLPGRQYRKRIAKLIRLSEGYRDFIEDARAQLTAVSKVTDAKRTEVAAKFRAAALVLHRTLQSGLWVEGQQDGDTRDRAATLETAPPEEEQMVGGTVQILRRLEFMQQQMKIIVQASTVGEVDKAHLELMELFSELVNMMNDDQMEMFEAWINNESELEEAEQLIIDEEYFFDKRTGSTDLLESLRDERKKAKCRCPEALRSTGRHKVFYTTYFAIYFAIVFSHLLFRLILGFENNGAVLYSFLPLPPQYDLGLRNILQLLFIPVLFGCMHGALFTLTLLPTPFARGIWRDVVKCAPGIRDHLPVDDLVKLHIMWGYILILSISTGATFWLVAMALDCLNDVPQACLAFAPEATVFVNPKENVLFLRYCIWPTWFFIIPLMEWAREERAILCFGKIQCCQTWWWELLIFSHVGVAMVTATMALAARLEIFYVILLGWGPYFFDKARERLTHTHKTTLIIKVGEDTGASSRLHLHGANNKPVSVHVIMALPRGFSSTAGQWIYFSCNAIDYTWHPFTLASASDSAFVNLEIGVRGLRENWEEDTNGLGQKTWFQKKGTETWTYKLFKHISTVVRDNRGARKVGAAGVGDSIELPVMIRGPYGAAYERCLDPSLGASVIMGAGTGVTSALSGLRDVVARKRRDSPTPGIIWFVWTTQAVDDLLWLWDSLMETLHEACVERIIQPKRTHRKSSKMMDWLGMTVYITKADRKLLSQFVESTRPQRGRGVTAQVDFNSDTDGYANPLRQEDSNGSYLTKEQVHAWMTDDKRLLANSLDDKGTHVVKLLRFVRMLCGNKQVAVSYCGPPGLTITLVEAGNELGAGYEFAFDTL
jgi:hypothetical protein